MTTPINLIKLIVGGGQLLKSLQSMLLACPTYEIKSEEVTGSPAEITKLARTESSNNDLSF